MKPRVPSILCLGLGLGLLLGSCADKQPSKGQELRIYTAEAVCPTATPQKEFPFLAQPLRTSQLSFRVGGPIAQFDVYPGNSYTQGSLIAAIDPRDFKLRKERAAAVHQQARTEFERIEALYRKENLSASVYEKAKADYLSSKTAYETASNELNDTRLTAPFGGYVGEVYVERHQEVKATERVLSLIDISQLRIEIYVTQEMAYAAKQMKSIDLRFDALPDRVFEARMAQVSKGTTRNNLSYLLTAFLPNDNGELLAGMSGKALLHTPQAEGLSGVCIPQTALCHRPTEGDYVWVVDPHTHQVKSQRITLEELLPDGWAKVSAGLQAGQKVAVSKLRFLSDGMKVVDNR